MKLKLANKHLILLVPFLQGLKLKGERSRARSKFLALAMISYESLHLSEVELLREYAVLRQSMLPLILRSCLIW